MALIISKTQNKIDVEHISFMIIMFVELDKKNQWEYILEIFKLVKIKKWLFFNKKMVSSFIYDSTLAFA